MNQVGCEVIFFPILFAIALVPLITRGLWLRRMHFGSVIATGSLLEYPFSRETNFLGANSAGELEQPKNEASFVELWLILKGRTSLYSVKTGNCLNSCYPGAHWICGYDANQYLEAELKKRFGLVIRLRTWSGYGPDERWRTVQVRVPSEDVGNLRPRWIDLCLHQMDIALRSGYTEGVARAIRADEIEIRFAPT